MFDFTVFVRRHIEDDVARTHFVAPYFDVVILCENSPECGDICNTRAPRRESESVTVVNGRNTGSESRVRIAGALLDVIALIPPSHLKRLCVVDIGASTRLHTNGTPNRCTWKDDVAH